MMLEPLKIGTYNEEYLYKYAQIKLDGYQIRIISDQYGKVTVLTRNNKDYTEKVMCSPEVRACMKHITPVTEVWGELYYPGKPASYISTALRKQDEALRFSAFCSPSVRPDTPLGVTKDFCAAMGAQFIDFYVLGNATATLHNALDYYHDVKALEVGGDIEGYVLKDGNMQNQARYKPSSTVDLIVSGFKDGTGKHEFMVGSMYVETIEGHKLANVGTGLTDDLREEISCKEDYYLGKVVEVKYQYVGAQGKLRHPSFVRFRDDKEPSECTLNQFTDLEKGLIV